MVVDLSALITIFISVFVIINSLIYLAPFYIASLYNFVVHQILLPSIRKAKEILSKSIRGFTSHQ